MTHNLCGGQQGTERQAEDNKVQILPDSLYGAKDELALHKSLIIARAFGQCPPCQYVLEDGAGVRLAVLIRYFCTH